MRLHLEGHDPLTAVITYQGRRHTCTSRTMYPGIDGMPVGHMWITNEIRVAFHRRDNTIVATVDDHGQTYELRPMG